MRHRPLPHPEIARITGERDVCPDHPAPSLRTGTFIVTAAAADVHLLAGELRSFCLTHVHTYCLALTTLYIYLLHLLHLPDLL